LKISIRSAVQIGPPGIDTVARMLKKEYAELEEVSSVIRPAEASIYTETLGGVGHEFDN
jgi:hypothetical protein